ncbi:unnamed protein product [Victoria cruziana]
MLDLPVGQQRIDIAY